MSNASEINIYVQGGFSPAAILFFKFTIIFALFLSTKTNYIAPCSILELKKNIYIVHLNDFFFCSF